MTEYETILVETRGRVGWITLNRPDALNALNTQTMHDVVSAASALDTDDGVGAIVITGSERAFAAGADIKEMESVTNSLEFLRSVYKNSRLERKVRIEAAKAALPYEFGKVGEMGIKQGRDAVADDVSENDDDFATAGNQRAARGQQRVS